MTIAQDWREPFKEVLARNETSKLVSLPPRKKLFSCKWVFNIKQKANGSIEGLKQDNLLRDSPRLVRGLLAYIR